MSKTVPAVKASISLPDDYRPRRHAALWKMPPERWRERLAEAVVTGAGGLKPRTYFRADDVGAGGRAFDTLCDLFREHSAPLALAVVPAWLSELRVAQLFESAPLEETLWGWHQHGWRHVNWQKAGKKSEFGEQRPYEKQWRDISQGQQKMREIFGDRLLPVFTPPWNRLSPTTMNILYKLEFRAVSTMDTLPRSPRVENPMHNLRMTVDLHTRKGKDAESDFQGLLDEIRDALARKEPVGFMIHHQRMNPFCFEFVDELLRVLGNDVAGEFIGFGELLAEAEAS